MWSDEQVTRFFILYHMESFNKIWEVLLISKLLILNIFSPSSPNTLPNYNPGRQYFPNSDPTRFFSVRIFFVYSLGKENN